MEFLIAAFIGFMNRVRGGLFTKQIKSKFPWWSRGEAIPLLALCCAIVTPGDIWVKLSVLIGFWVGFFPGYLGANHDIQSKKDFFLMFIRGFIYVAPVALLTVTPEYLLVGALFGPVYLFSNQKFIPDGFSRVHLNRGPDLGELLWGMVLGASLQFYEFSSAFWYLL